MLLVSLPPPGVTAEWLQLVTHVSDSASGNLRPPWLLRSLNGQFSCVTPLRRASILINECVSPWDHCTVLRTRPPPGRKFLSHLRKLKLTGRCLVPFLQSKALMYDPHFYPDKFYNGSQIEGKCQISLLLSHSAKTVQSPTRERPRHLSAKPQVFLKFFPIEPPYSVPFQRAGNSPGIFQPASIFWLGGNFSVSSN